MVVINEKKVMSISVVGIRLYMPIIFFKPAVDKTPMEARKTIRTLPPPPPTNKVPYVTGSLLVCSIITHATCLSSLTGSFKMWMTWFWPFKHTKVKSKGIIGLPDI